MKLSFQALVTLVTATSLILAAAPSSQAQVSVSLSGGLNACIDDDKPGDCSRIEDSGFGGLGVFYRVLPKLDVGVDLRFGGLTPQDDATTVERDIATLHMMATAVWLEPINERFTAEGRLGYGYASNTLSYKSVTGSDNANNWVSWSSFSLGAALSMEVMEKLHAGVGLDLYLQDGGTMCTKTTGSTCKDHEDPMYELMNGYLFARYRL
jgi:hypothetical protein